MDYLLPDEYCSGITVEVLNKRRIYGFGGEDHLFNTTCERLVVLGKTGWTVLEICGYKSGYDYGVMEVGGPALFVFGGSRAYIVDGSGVRVGPPVQDYFSQKCFKWNDNLTGIVGQRALHVFDKLKMKWVTCVKKYGTDKFTY